MSFHEKSAWIMSLSLLLGGALYFILVSSMSAEAGALPAPAVPALVVYTLLLVVLAIVGHLVVAIMAPGAANNPPDEREHRIVARASHISRYVIASGAVLSLMLYLVTHSGDLLFYGVLASLMIAQLSEYLLQIIFIRVG
jgi:uncharacterized membrane protein (DUF485 family)